MAVLWGLIIERPTWDRHEGLESVGSKTTAAHLRIVAHVYVFYKIQYSYLYPSVVTILPDDHPLDRGLGE